MAWRLKTKDGKYFEVRTFSAQPGKPQLCVIDSQDRDKKGTRVEIKKRHETQMAFRFFYKGAYYVLKAGENHLELEKVDTYASDCYWFERENIGGGNHYALRTVAGPVRYLSLATGKHSKLGFSKAPVFYIYTEGPI